jgi:hypothetical protein
MECRLHHRPSGRGRFRAGPVGERRKRHRAVEGNHQAAWHARLSARPRSEAKRTGTSCGVSRSLPGGRCRRFRWSVRAGVAAREAEPCLGGDRLAAVRVVLGHFVFVYIHPYMDGNGRMGRFLMNLMMAAGGYPWTLIPVTGRKAHMPALRKRAVERTSGRSRISWRASSKGASPENRCRKCRKAPRDQRRRGRGRSSFPATALDVRPACDIGKLRSLRG